MSASTSTVSGYVPSETTSIWSDKARLRRVLMIGGIAALVLVSGGMWLNGGRYISSEDAYVRTAKLMVSTDVSGLVDSVNVHEGQRVQKGAVLFTLDRRPFEIALANARAALAQTALDTESTRAEYRAGAAQIGASDASVRLAQSTFTRYNALTRSGAVAATELDQARSTLQSAIAARASAIQTAQADLAKLGGNPDLPADQTPAYMRAKAQVDEAQRQLDHAVVRAPFAGTVTAVDSLQPGTLVISAMAAFSTTSAVGLVSDENAWIDANLKETELTHVRDGNPVDITVDTYPGVHWKGHVGSVSPASDSSFSALPAENASGNWVKVVQRIPVRIVVDPTPGQPQLRTGMSTVISIDTGKRRITRLLGR